MYLENKVKINADTRNIVQGSGKTFNQALETQYGKVLSEIRSSYSTLEKASAVKIALLSEGICGNDIMNKMFTTDDSQFLFPAYMSSVLETTMASSDVVQYLIGGESGATSRSVITPVLNLLDMYNKQNLATNTVAEGAETSIRSLTMSEESTKLTKKMIGSRITYEAMREMQVDLFSRFITAIGQDIVRQNLSDVISVIDGASTVPILTTATVNVITNKELVRACTAYQRSFNTIPDTLIAGNDLYDSIAEMTYSSNEVSGVSTKIMVNLPQSGNTTINVINGDIAKISTKNVAKLYSKMYGPQRWVQTGTSLTEYSTSITDQANTVVISEISGYGNIVSHYGLITSK